MIELHRTGEDIFFVTKAHSTVQNEVASLQCLADSCPPVEVIGIHRKRLCVSRRLYLAQINSKAINGERNYAGGVVIVGKLSLCKNGVVVSGVSVTYSVALVARLLIIRPGLVCRLAVL